MHTDTPQKLLTNGLWNMTKSPRCWDGDLASLGHPQTCPIHGGIHRRSYLALICWGIETGPLGWPVVSALGCAIDPPLVWGPGKLDATSMPWALCHVFGPPHQFFSVWQGTLSCWEGHCHWRVQLLRGRSLRLQQCLGWSHGFPV